MIASRSNEIVLEQIDFLIREASSREIRSIEQFAEDELVLPMDGGPHEGELFRFDFQPFTRLLLNEITNGRWTEFIITGPSQSGKTLICFVLLVVYVTVELRKNIVVGVPDMKMADNKWKIDIQPVFQASQKLSKLLPTVGPGSKNGTVKDTITLTNGSVIKFMSPFGDDSNKAGFTAPFVCITEAARFSDPSQTSVEADPFRQLKARQRATARFTKERELKTDRRFFAEGTVTNEDELPWKAKAHSTESKIACPCVHCGQYVTPERDDFTGYESVESELDAAEESSFYCPKCGHVISDDDREVMNQQAKLIHKGQSIDRRGKVTGDPPRTTRLWFRWNAFNNLFVTSADLGAEEWAANQFHEDSPERQNAEKDLCQSIWCMPYAAPIVDEEPLKRSEVARRRDVWTVGVLPADTTLFTMGVDVGRWRCWYFGIAFRSNGALHCPVYGAVDTSLTKGGDIPESHEHLAILNCLRELRDIILRGWPMEGRTMNRVPDQVFVDSGWKPDPVWQFTRESGKGPKSLFLPILGRGKSQREKYRYTRPTKTGTEVRKIGEGWHLSYVRSRAGWQVTVDADKSKLDLQNCLRAAPGEPGALTLPNAPLKDHTTVSRHLASEVRKRYIDPIKGPVEEWVQTGQNHLLDCGGYAWMAGLFKDWTIPELGGSEMEEQSDEKPSGNWFSISA